jgi:uncharacterized protein YcbX
MGLRLHGASHAQPLLSIPCEDPLVIRVSGLAIYPIKSCRGIALTEAEVVERGFRHDREWMVVDAAGRFVSQRTRPQLARVAVRMSDRSLIIAANGMPPLEVPLVPARRQARTVTIWRDTCRAEPCGPPAARWFSDLLGAPVELVRMPSAAVRRVDPRYAGPADQVGFADAFPFLLLSEASLDELNRRLAAPMPMDRFRPNIVVSSCQPHAEDGWTTIAVGGIAFTVAKPCVRCVITTTDQHTGERGAEPLRTLASYRTVDGEVRFGQNLVHRGSGAIRVGDPCQVVTREPGDG